MTTTGARVELIDETQLRLALMQAMALESATVSDPHAVPPGGDPIHVFVKIDGKPEHDAFIIEKVSFSTEYYPGYIVVELDSGAEEYGQLDARIEVTFERNELVGTKLLKYGVLSEDSE